MKIKKVETGKYHVSIRDQVVMMIQDDMPSLKQSPNKSMYLWVKVGVGREWFQVHVTVRTQTGSKRL